MDALCRQEKAGEREGKRRKERKKEKKEKRKGKKEKKKKKKKKKRKRKKKKKEKKRDSEFSLVYRSMFCLGAEKAKVLSIPPVTQICSLFVILGC